MVVVDGYVVVVDGGDVVCGDVVVVGSLEVETLTMVDVVLAGCGIVLVVAVVVVVVLVVIGAVEVVAGG
jgi:hypothetical protein